MLVPPPVNAEPSPVVDGVRVTSPAELMVPVPYKEVWCVLPLFPDTKSLSEGMHHQHDKPFYFFFLGENLTVMRRYLPDIHNKFLDDILNHATCIE